MNTIGHTMKRRYWTTLEVRALRALYSTTTNKELGARFDRVPKAIALLAFKLGLRKSPAHIAAHCRYQQGHATWNKGKPWSPPGSQVTRFKKWHRGARQRPVGTERVERDGVMVKVAEPRVWRPKARVVWERHFGEIPTGRHRAAEGREQAELRSREPDADPPRRPYQAELPSAPVRSRWLRGWCR